MGLIAFLGTCTPTWCYVRDGVGWGGNNNVLWHATLKKYDATLAHVVHVREHNCDVSFIKNMLHYIATLAHAVNVCEHKFDVTFIEYRATLAHVVNVREHKFDVTLIDYVVTLAHTKKAWKNWSQSLLPKKTNPMEEPTNIVGSGREASSGGKILPSKVPFWKNFPNAWGRLRMWFLGSTRRFQTFCLGVVKK